MRASRPEIFRSAARRRLAAALRRLPAERSGNVAMLFAISLVPIVAVVGAAVDYSRASTASAQLKASVDSAALAAAQKIGASYSHGDRVTTARAAMYANLASSSMIGPFTMNLTDVTLNGSQGINIAASAQVDTSFMRIFGFNHIAVNASADALASIASNAEIALVLDTTGSMVNDMPAMKTAARNFANAVFAASSSGNVKMSVVPYVAAVNVGPNINPAMLDANVESWTHGLSFRNRDIGYMNGCNPYPNGNPGGGSSGGGDPPPDPGSPGGRDRTGALDRPVFDPLGKARDFAQQVFGVTSAKADVTANTIAPVATTPYTPGAPYVTDGSVAQLPAGFAAYYYCWLMNPDRVSHLDLFRRIPGARWKGCVEARPEPFDVTDAPPTAADPVTRFVPYFAPDETAVDTGSGVFPYNNDYMADYHGAWAANYGAPPGWAAGGEYYNTVNILKYDGSNAATLQEAGNAVTKGPNAYCPDEMLPLTSNHGAVVSRIDSLSYWPGGGTISSEGLMWGWRSISPNAPFALGAPYGTPNTKKYIVLMSDGLNSLVANRPGNSTMLLSDYTAYSYLTHGRMGPNTFAGASAYLNARMQAACDNAKAQNITIYTVLFRETDPATRDLMRNCASSPGQAMLAGDSVQLAVAFQSIAADLQKLRLVR